MRPPTEREASVAGAGRVAVLDRGRSASRGWTVATCRAGTRSASTGGRLRPTSGKRARETRRAVDDRHREQRDTDAGEAVEPEVVAGRHHREPDPGRPERPERLRPPVRQTREEDDADDQRVGGVQARHRGVRVRGELTRPSRCWSTKPTPEQARRRGRHEEVAERGRSRSRAGSSCGSRTNCVVAAQVDPEHREADDRELGVPVRPRDGGLEQVPLVDEVLERQLVQPVRDVRLEVDDVEPFANASAAACGRRGRARAGRARAKPNQIASWRPRSAQPRGRYRRPAATTVDMTLSF